MGIIGLNKHGQIWTNLDLYGQKAKLRELAPILGLGEILTGRREEVIFGKCSCIIPMQDYGMMNGKKVLELADSLMA